MEEKYKNINLYGSFVGWSLKPKLSKTAVFGLCYSVKGATLCFFIINNIYDSCISALEVIET